LGFLLWEARPSSAQGKQGGLTLFYFRLPASGEWYEFVVALKGFYNVSKTVLTRLLDL
jgi:hypothetical protein